MLPECFSFGFLYVKISEDLPDNFTFYKPFLKTYETQSLGGGHNCQADAWWVAIIFFEKHVFVEHPSTQCVLHTQYIVKKKSIRRVRNCPDFMNLKCCRPKSFQILKWQQRHQSRYGATRD